MKQSTHTLFLLVLLGIFLLTGCRYDALFNPVTKTTQKKKPGQSEKANVSMGRGCTIETVRNTVRPHLDSIKRCYRKGRARNEDLSGRLAIGIYIDMAGSAKRLDVKEDTLGDTDVTQCIFDVLRPLAYPYPMKEMCVVVYPFNFTAGPGKPPQTAPPAKADSPPKQP